MPLSTVRIFTDFTWHWDALQNEEGEEVGKALIVDPGGGELYKIPFTSEQVQRLGQKALGIGKVEVPGVDVVTQLQRRGGRQS